MKHLLCLFLLIGSVVFPKQLTAQMCGVRSVTVYSGFHTYVSAKDVFAPSIFGDGSIVVWFGEGSQPLGKVLVNVFNTTTLLELAGSINHATRRIKATVLNLGTRLSPYFVLKISSTRRKCGGTNIRLDASIEVLSAMWLLFQEQPCCVHTHIKSA